MNYLNISTCSLCDGIDVRVVLWVSGCTHYCEGCHNQEAWDFKAGKEFTAKSMNLLLQAMDHPYVKGLTLSGGDPLNPKNIGQVTKIAQIVKEEFPEKNIWCYTGYDWTQVQYFPIMKYVDVLVDGKFILSQRDTTLKFKGSPNQNIIDVQKSLTEHKLVLFECGE